MSRLTRALLLLLAMLGLVIGQDQSTSTGPGFGVQTWIAPGPQDQLNAEGRDDQKGFGRIFIPAMTKPTWEPEVTVYLNNHPVIPEARMGTSIFLEPGLYKVVFGNGVINEQKIVMHINLKHGDNRIVPVDWTGLIIRIVDPSRKYLRQNYEIFGMEYEESFGINISKDENEPEEHPDTWILRPGMYKITKAGMPFNTPIHFATVRLLPGTLTQFTIVMDEQGNFVGSGIMKELETQSLKKTDLRTYSALNASFSLYSDDKEQEDEFVTKIDVVTEFINRFQYDYKQHYLLSEPSYQLQLSNTVEQTELVAVEKNELDVKEDELVFDNIYIYYLFPAVGIYGRLDFKSKIFPKTDYFSKEESPQIRVVDSEGNLLSDSKETEFDVSPVLSPLDLRESLGLDFTPVKGTKLRFSLRTGWGFWQTIQSDVYSEGTVVGDTVADTVIYEKLESEFSQGLEILARNDYRPTSRLILTTKLDILFPNKRGAKNKFEIENLINISLLKFVSLEYKLLFAQNYSKRDYPWIENSLGIKLSYIF